MLASGSATDEGRVPGFRSQTEVKGMKGWAKWLSGLLAALLLAAPLSGAPAATPSEARQRLAAGSVEYAATLYSPSSALVLDETLRPDYARFSPGYVVAALMQGEAGGRVQATLKAILATQDLTPRSPTFGLFPQDFYAPTPSLEATSHLLPLLAWVAEHGEALPVDLRAQVTQALEMAYRAVGKTSAEPDHPYLALLRAAALATAGRALGHQEGVRQAEAAVSQWLRQVLQAGCWMGHGASAEVLRLGALAWIAQAAGAPAPDVRLALRLGYLDLIQRVQPGSGALAGAASFVRAVDYIQGGDLNRYLLYLWGVGDPPSLVRPNAMYLAACAWTPEGLEPVPVSADLPRSVVTVAKEGAPVTRTDTYLTDLFSLGTMTGLVGPRALPVMITLAQSPQRPTCYLYAVPPPAAVWAVQHEGLALITLGFSQIGGPGRVQAYAHSVLGPRQEVEKVLLSDVPWTGAPAAVGVGSTVAVQRAGVYVGLSLGQSGPVQVAPRYEATKPGVLRWQAEGPEAELELLIYAREQTYEIFPPLDNLVVSVVVQVAPQSAFPSLEDFSRSLQRGRLRQTVTASTERIAPEEDPFTRFLNQDKPKSRTQYRHVQHLLLESTYQVGEETLLRQRVDLPLRKVLLAEVQGVAPTPAGPWESPLLTLPWDMSQARAALTGTGR